MQNDPVGATDALGLAFGLICKEVAIDGGYIWYCTLLGDFDLPAGQGDKARGSGNGPGIKAPLTGKKLKKYNEERAKARDKLTSSLRCREFLSKHGIDPDAALDALNRQRAYDGANSTISIFNAGFVDPSKVDWSNLRVVQSIRGPVSGIFTSSAYNQTQAQTAFWVGGSFGTTVDSRSDVYYRDSGLSASVILHEALHSLLGADDSALAQQLEVQITPGGETEPISQALHDHDCGG